MCSLNTYSVIRPTLGYCTQVYHPYLKKNIANIEKVQHRATKLINECRNLNYEKGNIDAEIPEIKKSSSQSLSQRIASLKLSNVQMREWLVKQRESVQPWGEFLNGKKFKLPKSVAPVGQRIIRNVTRFQSNYIFVVLALLAFCVLTSPILLVALAACLGACYLISVRSADKPLTLMGREISPAHQYGAVGVASFPLFWIAGAGSAVFWVIGASIVFILGHSSLYSVEEAEPFELQMETV